MALITRKYSTIATNKQSLRLCPRDVKGIVKKVIQSLRGTKAPGSDNIYEENLMYALADLEGVQGVSWNPLKF